MNSILRTIKKYIPKGLFTFFQPFYHYLLTLLGAIIYRFPGKKITVIGITGTKGKTSSAEILNSMFEAAGKKTALAGTLRIKVGDDSKRNMYKMTLPGRFFVQNFLRKAVDAECDVVILEITSEAAKQFRHKFTYLNGLIFLNISHEHIESHGGFDNYLAAKLSIGKELEKSKKEKRVMVANNDDIHGKDFLNLKVPTTIPFSITDAKNITLEKDSSRFVFLDHTFHTSLIGRFNIYNIIGCGFMAEAFGVSPADIANGVTAIKEIDGRGQKITLSKDHPHAGQQNFTAIVDYAHTTNSLEAIYQAFEHDKKICVLGNTGGGRDTWKRPEMAKIADTHCSHIILTDEDPYDEDPVSIVNTMKDAISITETEVIMDRGEAIERAVNLAEKDDVVIITGKGTDPYIMGPNGTKTSWSDADVTRDAIEKKLNK
jgi:UDP-N-acetylmuramoyl-L-alanyl-D-glutamate--2,6-diaminopimelate ligase